mgnify:CR=1 FL=1
MDKLTKEQRHKNMVAVKNKDSKIELTLRKILWDNGYRYRKNYSKVYGKPDIVFIGKKVAIFCLVGIGHVLDTQVIQNGSVLRTAVIFFYLSNEGISIIENVALIGLPVPKKLKEVLEQLHEEADEKKEDE